MHYANSKHKKSRITILISDYVDFEIKHATRDKEHFTMMKESNLRVNQKSFMCVHLMPKYQST